MQARIFLPTIYGNSKATPKISANFQSGGNWGSHSWGHLWLRASAPDLPRWGFRKASQWFCPLVKNRTSARENHCGLSELWQHELGFLLMYWNYLPKWTGKKKICHHDPDSKQSSWEKMREQEKDLPAGIRCRHTGGLHPCHIAEALGIGVPTWSAGHDRDNSPVNASVAVTTSRPNSDHHSSSSFVWRDFSLQLVIKMFPRIGSPAQSMALLLHKSCPTETPSVKTLKNYSGV